MTRRALALCIVGAMAAGIAAADDPPTRGAKQAGRDWWSLQPLRDAPVPSAGDGWARNDVDRFIAAKLAERGLAPSSRADPRTLVRRVYFDLVGLPPPPEAIDAFAANPSQQAWEQLVDDLLASPHYGERWARHWLDIARFGETHGYEYNLPRDYAWHYRDWVIRALNDDMPYDRFVRMQIAGDLLEPDSLDGAAAVGFLVAGIHNHVLGKNPIMRQQARQDELEEMAGVVGQALLGMTINCARCHDHKYDPIPTADYYRFVAALDGVTHGDRAVARRGDDSARVARLAAERDAAMLRLRDAVEARLGRPVTDENRLQLRDAIPANDAGVAYRVAFTVAPTVWADASQATGESDGLIVSVVRADGTALSRELVRPGAWRGRSPTFAEHRFEYTGDGGGPVRLRIAPAPIHSNRFGGAIDDLRVTTADGARTLLIESFDAMRSSTGPGAQFDTRLPVHARASLERWEGSGLNAAHAVERSPGNFAAQFYAGAGSPPTIEPATPEEQAMRATVDSLSRQIESLGGDKVTVFTVVAVNPAPMRIHERGDPRTLGSVVTPGALAAVTGPDADFKLAADAPDADRRLKLAQWITHRDNPLLSRVIVNRVWRHHFGSSFVETPSDFGFNGGAPTHAALLDHLAVRFRDEGYSLKRLHRTIVTSATYQQSSRPADNAAPAPAREADGSNALLWRQNGRRMDAETLRDAVLDIAGALNRTVYGPPYRDVRVEKVDVTNYYLAIDPEGEEFNRRSIYRWHARGERSALLETFDCPDPAIAAPVRNVTTTPSQALSQWNASFIARMSERFAERVRAEAGEDEAAQVVRMYRLALGRAPTAEELAEAARLVRGHGLAVLARVMFNANETIWIE